MGTLPIASFGEMTKRPQSSVRDVLTGRACARAFPSLVALCLVALQLATALHFALVPHGFNARLNGFVHLHRAPISSVQAHSPNRQALVTGVPSCAPESCPIGFSGPTSALLSPGELSGLLSLPIVNVSGPQARVAQARKQVLLCAPKTSPPQRA
jgi:hypothetical protein